MKKCLVVIVVIILLVILNTAFASILSDPVFAAASTTLSNAKKVTYSAETRLEKDTIKVSRVELYEQYADGSWHYAGDLDCPLTESHNNIYYGSSRYYTSDIGTGTYRLYTTFWADGYTLSKYSNTMTF